MSVYLSPREIKKVNDEKNSIFTTKKKKVQNHENLR